MPRTPRTPSLARLFDQSPDPAYALDARRRIVYVNSSLLQWTGLSRECLIGRVVEYHSQEESGVGPGINTNLCPPPTALAGQPAAGHVWRTNESGEVVYRLGHFLPLGQAGEPSAFTSAGEPEAEVGDASRCVGIVAVLSPRELSAAELELQAQEEPTFIELHRALVELRTRRGVRGVGGALIGESDLMRRARRQVELAAGGRSPALIVGSDVWQRRRVAEAIPYVGGERTEEMVVPFDSGLLDENLLAWSLQPLEGRGRDRVTLLFHDVHELPSAAQTLLAERMPRWPAAWRVIATCESLGTRPVALPTLDVRLFHWLSTLVIDLAPLADRIEDLPLVAQYFVEQCNAAGTKQVAGITPAALDRMHLYDWPGGLAQLREVVSAAHAAAKGPEIGSGDLPPPLSQVLSAAAFPREELRPIALEDLLAEIETDLIRRALALAHGNKTQAAALLGMTRPRLYRRMEQLGMPPVEAQDDTA